METAIYYFEKKIAAILNYKCIGAKQFYLDVLKYHRLTNYMYI